MSKKKITYFGEVDIHEDDYIQGCATLGDQKVTLSLDLDNDKEILQQCWEELEDYLSHLEEYKVSLEKSIVEDYNNGGTTAEYISWHLEELEDIDDLLSTANQVGSKEEQVLSLLTQRLQNIAFYPGEEGYAVWDFMIDKEISDEILVVYTDNKGKAIKITWES